MTNTKYYIKTNGYKTSVAIILAVAILFSLVGCKKRAASDMTINNGQALLATPTATLEPQPEAGGELRMPIPINPNVSNPLTVNTEEMMNLFSLVFESLVRCDQTNKLVPALAENWSCDDSGRVWTFHLRQGVKWHAGAGKFTAADVKYTLDSLKQLGAQSYYSFVFNRVADYEIVDDNTIKITMKQPGLSALYALTFPVMCAANAGAQKPAGTGPYFISEADNRHVELVVNENWWRKTAYISKITFYARDNNEVALASFQAGQLNMVPTSTLSAGKYREEGVTSVLDIMTQHMEVLLINYDNPLLTDIRLRKAIAYALDRNNIISNVYMNRAFACDVPIAPDSWLYESKSKLYDYNVSKAAALLDEMGWTDVDNDGIREHSSNYQDVSFRLLVNENSETTARKSAAAAIAEDLLEVGIKVEIISVPFSITDPNSEFLAKLESGDFDLALVGFNTGRDSDLTQYLNPGGKLNYGGYNNEAISHQISAMNSSVSETDMVYLASELQMLFANEMPFITLYFRMNSIVYSAQIKGIQNIREPDIFRNVEKWYILTE